MRKPLSNYERKVIKRAAAEKVSEMMNFSFQRLISDTSDPDQFTVSMNISECYDYWVLYFINKVKKERLVK